MPSAKDHLYRQRVYRLDQEDSTYKSFIYELNDPSIYTGQWNNDSLWGAISPDSVLLKEGREVSLLWDEASHVYTGAPDSATCMSTLRGASFATSIITVYPRAINSWDRGLDSTVAYVWDAEKAGYEFIRQE
ncbi:MAG: CpcT/CpeT family chromophore lyase [Flavobacteriales bacterium]|nr:CpcT/CpeT family chromophore lyase [Flavobacteriales bacterium]